MQLRVRASAGTPAGNRTTPGGGSVRRPLGMGRGRAVGAGGCGKGWEAVAEHRRIVGRSGLRRGFQETQSRSWWRPRGGDEVVPLTAALGAELARPEGEKTLENPAWVSTLAAPAPSHHSRGRRKEHPSTACLSSTPREGCLGARDGGCQATEGLSKYKSKTHQVGTCF